mgnify:CR=1 FL=1
MYQIFIVEDDPSIAKQSRLSLESFGCAVTCAADFYHVAEEIREQAPDLVLMDITLPGPDGFVLCREIRRFSKIPVIFISSASEPMNIVTAVNAGADDFIAKPFDLNVLNAKVRAQLRRAYDMSDAAERLEADGVVLDLAALAVSCGDASRELTKNEFQILKTLFEHKGRVVTRGELMDAIWQTDEYIDDNTLTVNINRLRKKLEDIGAPHLIATKKGLGYLAGEQKHA